MDKIKRFLLLNFDDFENIAIPFPVGLVITGVVLALISASFVINYRKLYTTRLLRGLLRQSAIGESGAKTLRELRLDTFSVRHALSRSGRLTYYVKRAGESKPTYEEYVKKTKERGYKGEKIDFSTAAFYIDEEREDEVKRLLERPTDNWISPIILTFVLLAVLVLSFFFAEDLLTLINNLADK